MSAVHRVLVGHGLAALAMSLPWPLLLVLVDDASGAGLVLGLAGAARMLPYVVLSWATGTLADRFRRDRIVRLTVAARAVLLTGTAVAVVQDRLLVAVLTATAAVAAGTPAYPALAAAMPGLAGPDRRRATDLLVTVEVASFVVGPAIGGLLLTSATRALLPGAAVVLSLAALVVLHGVHLPAPAGRSGGPALRSVLRATAAGSGVRRAIGTVALLNGVLAAVGLALLPLTEGTGGFGVATAALGFGALAAPLLWWCGRSSASRARAGLLVLTGALVLVPVVPGLLPTLPALAVVGAAAVHVEGAATEAVQDGVPDAHRAGALGLTDSAMVGAALLGALVAPLLVGLLGATWFVALLAATCAAVALVPRRNVHTPAVATAGVRQIHWVPSESAGGESAGDLSRPEPWLPEQRQPSRPAARSSSGAAPRG
jgi:MFS family permease